MPLRHTYAFHPVAGTTAPSFQAGATNVFASTANMLQSTALGRVWAGPSGRAVRLAESAGIDYFVNFGSSLATASSTDSILMLGGTVETFHVAPTWTHIAIKSISTSTGVKVNVTPGYGK